MTSSIEFETPSIVPHHSSAIATSPCSIAEHSTKLNKNGLHEGEISSKRNNLLVSQLCDC